jgi:hypothetical protein
MKTYEYVIKRDGKLFDRGIIHAKDTTHARRILRKDFPTYPIQLLDLDSKKKYNSGWFKESRRHREAKLKSLDKKRKSHPKKRTRYFLMDITSPTVVSPATYLKTDAKNLIKRYKDMLLDRGHKRVFLVKQDMVRTRRDKWNADILRAYPHLRGNGKKGNKETM